MSSIKMGKYTHILLRPKQAALKSFQNALRNPQLQAIIGLLAIDECYLVKHQKDFWPAFSILGKLRVLLRREIVQFGCSTTLNKEAEQLILNNAGFCTVGYYAYQTEVIRTSINRANISICISPLPRKKVNLFKALYFLLDTATDIDK